jgi:carbamoyltransferase
MVILGLTAYAHDSAVCLVRDGEVIAAIEEERFTREKHTVDFPAQAIRYCLRIAEMDLNDIDYVGFSWDPWIGVHKRIALLLYHLPRALSFPGSLSVKWLNIVRADKDLRRLFSVDGKPVKYKFCYVPHHICHAASSFLGSPFDECAFLSLDATGEWTTTMYGVADNQGIRPVREVSYPHSLGFLYGAVTQYLGFRICSGEGKTMGLAPYGKPKYYPQFEKMIRLVDGWRLVMDLSYFQHFVGQAQCYSKKMIDLLGPARAPESEIEDRHADVAASLQKRTEDLILDMVEWLHENTGMDHLCLAGGVSLNCVANGKIAMQSSFRDVFVQPAANDAGGALGAALYISNILLRQPRKFMMNDAYLGPAFGGDRILETLKKYDYPYEKIDHPERVCARLLAEGKIIGWFQGRMEWGPRALGNRSILADPREGGMKDVINARVKHRESFRPFAPSVLKEDAARFFEGADESPFMLMAFRVKPDRAHLIPAIVHVDGTARVQTVDFATNPMYWGLINEFKKLTGVPVLLNTSFNVRGQPIVCTPDEAIACFASTDLDYLAIGDYLVSKSGSRNAGNTNPPSSI